MKAPLRNLLALCLATLAGCGGGLDAQPAESAAAATTVGAGASAPVHPSGIANAQFLRRLQSARVTVAHRGVRRVEQHWRIGDEAQELSYREQVASDGAGRFAIEALEQLTPGSNQAAESAADGSAADGAAVDGAFVLLHQARAGFTWRYRDFAVRDVEAFLLNYDLLPLGSLAVVLGRPCDEYFVQRSVGHAVRYSIAVDRETGLVLRTRHETAAGELLGLVEYESLELAPDLSAVAWHTPVTLEEALERDPNAAAQQLGFRPRLPRTDGGVFRLLEAQLIIAPDPQGGEQRWAKHTLTDGVEVLFFLHGGNDPAAREDVVRVAPPVGPWNTAEGSLRGEQFTCLGRVSVDELLDVIASTL